VFADIEGSGSMRAVIKLALVGLVTFAIAFVVRHALFWDVMPVSWNEESSATTGGLIAAYLLLSLENLGAAVAAIAVVTGLVALAWSRITKSVTLSRVLPFGRSPILSK
jgi:hypothetical protein